jgi:hypothetical protein
MLARSEVIVNDAYAAREHVHEDWKRCRRPSPSPCGRGLGEGSSTQSGCFAFDFSHPERALDLDPDAVVLPIHWLPGDAPGVAGPESVGAALRAIAHATARIAWSRSSASACAAISRFATRLPLMRISPVRAIPRTRLGAPSTRTTVGARP